MISVMPKKRLRAQVYKRRQRGQPMIRWLDDVLEDLRRMDVSGYTEITMDRRHGRRLVLEVRVHVWL